MTRGVWALRVIPFVAGALGGLVALPLFGLLGSLLGIAGGFLCGAIFIVLRFTLRVEDAKRREAAMHAEAMEQLRALQAMGPHRLAATPSRLAAAEIPKRVERALSMSNVDDVRDELERLRLEYPKSALILTRLVQHLHQEGDKRWLELLPLARVAVHNVGALPMLAELDRLEPPEPEPSDAAPSRLVEKSASSSPQGR